MKGKKGVSTVVATVLILLLTVSAFAILSQFLIPFVRDSLNDAGECKDYEGYFSIQENVDNGTGSYNYNCLDDKKGNLTGISVRGRAELADKLDNIRGFMVVLKSNTRSESFKIFKGENNQNVWMIDEYPAVNPLDVPGPNDVITYVLNGSDSYEQAEVYTIVSSGKVCNLASKIPVTKCLGVKLL